MSCKYNNSMFTTILKDLDEYEYFDIDEVVEEPIEELDYSFAEEEAKELEHLQKLVSRYGSTNE